MRAVLRALASDRSAAATTHLDDVHEPCQVREPRSDERAEKGQPLEQLNHRKVCHLRPLRRAGHVLEERRRQARQVDVLRAGRQEEALAVEHHCKARGRRRHRELAHDAIGEEGALTEAGASPQG